MLPVTIRLFCYLKLSAPVQYQAGPMGLSLLYVFHVPYRVFSHNKLGTLLLLLKTQAELLNVSTQSDVTGQGTAGRAANLSFLFLPAFHHLLNSWCRIMGDALFI